jgi:hypothetical protein
MWAEILKIGIAGVGMIVDYATANEARKAELRAKANADEAATYDLIDNHLLDGNKIIDDEVDKKFDRGA